MWKKEFNREILAKYCENIGYAAHDLVMSARCMATFIVDREVDLQTRAALLEDWREACVQIADAQKILQIEMAAIMKTDRPE